MCVCAHKRARATEGEENRESLQVRKCLRLAELTLFFIPGCSHRNASSHRSESEIFTQVRWLYP